MQSQAPRIVREAFGRVCRPGPMLLAFIVGCSGRAEPAGLNAACFRALDCQAGLVCVEGRCTNDIGPLVPAGAGAAPQPEPASESGSEGEIESGGDAG